ncbi:hypothetical protein [Azospirillum canadense]|uniref:hypothetical protein n=1 Tax=Azospirillum canadense TaxID=403962 RepID=UPI0022270D09|nr:hypothetical protein [Azospirillum canadense]MCW2237669.1 hypothetical protein [Azospirillum canadense]
MSSLNALSRFSHRSAFIAILACVQPVDDVEAEEVRQCGAVASKQEAMPDLSRLVRRSGREVHNTGRLIKGIYYANRFEEQNSFVAFHNACYQMLEENPFLVFSFSRKKYYFDSDRNGCVDEVGALLNAEIDPADFYARLPDAATYCYIDGHPL